MPFRTAFSLEKLGNVTSAGGELACSRTRQPSRLRTNSSIQSGVHAWYQGGYINVCASLWLFCVHARSRRGGRVRLFHLPTTTKSGTCPDSSSILIQPWFNFRFHDAPNVSKHLLTSPRTASNKERAVGRLAWPWPMRRAPR